MFTYFKDGLFTRNLICHNDMFAENNNLMMLV